MESIKLENTECGVIVPSYEDLILEEYEPNNLFNYELKHYNRVALFFCLREENICFSVNKTGNNRFGFVTIESDFRCFYDEPFTEQNYNKALEVLKNLLFKGESE